MTATLTDLQFRTLDLYAHCEMNGPNGATPKSASDVWTYLWADERSKDLGISEQALGGVLTSLITAGLVSVLSPGFGKGQSGDKDGSFAFTDAGFEAWRAERTKRGLPDRS